MNPTNPEKAGRLIVILPPVLATMMLLLYGWPCWFFRDGIGPDAEQTHGRMAFHRFFAHFWPALVPWAIICLICLGIARKYSRRAP